jgi:hypothetical protein
MSEGEIEEEMEKGALTRETTSKGGICWWRRHPYRSGRNSSYRTET